MVAERAHLGLRLALPISLAGVENNSLVLPHLPFTRCQPSCPQPDSVINPSKVLPVLVREGMVPSERARLRRPGSEEGEARR